ncbi:hypothetical protein JCM6882_000038 [Rhodosporidiobolus microsporus]
MTVTSAIVSDTALPPNGHIPERAAAPAASTSPPSLFSLQGSTVVVTGAGRGIGQAVAKGIVEAGGAVACIDLHPEPSNSEGEWDAIKQAAEKAGVSATYHVCDITDEEALGETFKQIEQTSSGLLRAVLHGAAVQQMLSAVDYPIDDFRRIMEINVTGTFVTSKVTANFWKDRNIKGSLVLIASNSGVVANRGVTSAAYNTSKAAVLQMCRSLAQEWGPAYGVRVNTLSPGFVRTAMTDRLLVEKPEIRDQFMSTALLGRLGTPEDLIGPAVFLLSEASAWMTGADLRFDGGQTATA